MEVHFGYRRHRRKLQGIILIAILLCFSMVNGSRDNFAELLEKNRTETLKERIKQLKQENKVFIPGKVETLPPPPDRSFEMIMKGEFRQVSVEKLYQFLDRMRESTIEKQLEPLWSHEKGCICMDHVKRDLLTQLVRYTRDNPKYGESLLARPGFQWAPPVHRSYELAVNKTKILAHAYLGIVIVMFILSWAAILILMRYRKLKNMPPEVVAVEMEARPWIVEELARRRTTNAPGRSFDLSQTDLL